MSVIGAKDNNEILPDEHWDSLGVCLRRIPAFFEFLNKVRCGSPVYHIADSIVRKLIIDVSTILTHPAI